MNLRQQEARTGFAPGQLANRSAAVLASFRLGCRQAANCGFGGSKLWI
jgi:hypothetical protein